MPKDVKKMRLTLTRLKGAVCERVMNVLMNHDDDGQEDRVRQELESAAVNICNRFA